MESGGREGRGGGGHPHLPLLRTLIAANRDNAEGNLYSGKGGGELLIDLFLRGCTSLRLFVINAMLCADVASPALFLLVSSLRNGMMHEIQFSLEKSIRDNSFAGNQRANGNS